MPVSIVVGGQYGSEGKGKVALELVRTDPSTTIVVRPGGTNSGHTGFSKGGKRYVLRQLPAAAVDGDVDVVFPAGSYVDPSLLFAEIGKIGFRPSRVVIDPRAHVIQQEHAVWEENARLVQSIGSTGSGTGAAVISRIARYAPQVPAGMPASECEALQPFLAETSDIMAGALDRGERILIEGTQGFGLSVLHSNSWPKCTSRDTTAAGFLSEAGLSPLAVDRVVLVIRSFPIRVAGDSGPLPDETTWESIAADAGANCDLQEFTSVTQKLRRVGKFNAEIVRAAIQANAPTDIVLNHLDHVDYSALQGLTSKALEFVKRVEDGIERSVSFVGVAADRLERVSMSHIGAA